MMTADSDLEALVTFLRRVPGIAGAIGSGRRDDGFWWVKFRIDIDHPLAWNVVQEFGCVLNYLSVNERLPAVFMPVSPAPYLNGGPRQFLSWVIESRSADFSAADAAKWLEGRLPQPVDDQSQWPDWDD
jgi:hypothetical protein